MIKTLVFNFILISFFVIFAYGDVPGIASNDGVHTPDWYEIGTTGGDSNGDSGSGYQYQQPVYGNTGYTYGQVNQMYNVNTGSNNGDYNGYSNNYWTCVNQYRGQYYYSYTYGKYICDARANRYG